jgi:3-isopropylmalate/(R)-2-methylmalate dehydratase small subunit
MDAFTTFTSIAMPIDILNCDTDQIIPARFLRYRRNRDGFERFLFHDLRFDDDGAEKPDFIYNKEPYREAKIIVADLNWGCGSSRENAVHALVANGIRAVIAPSFGDIHFNNCMKNGVLPVRLSEAACEGLRRQLHDQPGARIGVDLAVQTVTGPDGESYAFEIDPFDKYRMLNGLDDIAVTLEYEAELSAYEAAHAGDYDWLY